MTETKRAVVLLSGGLDSTTTLALARSEDLECYCLTVSYGQRHEHELEAARRVARKLGAAKHLVLDVNMSAIGGSALTTDIEVPKDRDLSAEADGNADGREIQIPLTYVPARNTVFLSLALAWAEVLKAAEIWIGVSAVDYSGYPDCRPAFLEAFERLAAVATREGIEGASIKVRAPLIDKSKAQTIRLGLEQHVDYGWTHTCYDPFPDGAACRRCDACQLRLRAFAELGLEDPVPYR